MKIKKLYSTLFLILFMPVLLLAQKENIDLAWSTKSRWKDKEAHS